MSEICCLLCEIKPEAIPAAVLSEVIRETITDLTEMRSMRLRDACQLISKDQRRAICDAAVRVLKAKGVQDAKVIHSRFYQKQVLGQGFEMGSILELLAYKSNKELNEKYIQDLIKESLEDVESSSQHPGLNGVARLGAVTVNFKHAYIEHRKGEIKLYPFQPENPCLYKFQDWMKSTLDHIERPSMVVLTGLESEDTENVLDVGKWLDCLKEGFKDLSDLWVVIVVDASLITTPEMVDSINGACSTETRAKIKMAKVGTDGGSSLVKIESFSEYMEQAYNATSFVQTREEWDGMVENAYAIGNDEYAPNLEDHGDGPDENDNNVFTMQ